MRLLIASICVISLAGCPSPTPETPAEQGPPGERGPAGEPGPTGPQGPAGPPGEVRIIDGGTLVGPPGAGLTVAVIDVGDARCPMGGVEVTQHVDGGVTHVCNGLPGMPGLPGATGATGATGAAGPIGPAGPAGAVGPSGAMGPVGPAGAMGPTGATGAVGPAGATGAAGPAGATGAVGPAGATGATGAVGPAGAMGPAGPAGPAGAAGATGPVGPAGPPGAVLYLDGGVVMSDPTRPTLAGYTTTKTTANMGGRIPAHQLCNAEFPGSYFCTEWEFKMAEPVIAPPWPGAWIDQASSDDERATIGFCSNWSSTANYSHAIAGTNGYIIANSTAGTTCASSLSVACCYRSGPVKFRGYTASTTTANMGGRITAHQACHAAFPGSRFCTEWQFKEANPAIAPPAPGAWVDQASSDDERATIGFCSNWSSTANYSHALAAPSGYIIANSTAGTTCASSLPIACCQQ